VDIWAIGVMMYKGLTGKYPFGSKAYTYSDSKGERDKRLERNI